MYKVYYLPKEHYCGVTKRPIEKRLQEHIYRYNRDVSDVVIIAEFECKKKAFRFEAKYHKEHKTNGSGETNESRAEKSKIMKDKQISNILKKKVICLNNGKIYDSARECARSFNKKHQNLIKHLNKDKKHKYFLGFNFSYYNENLGVEYYFDGSLPLNGIPKNSSYKRPLFLFDLNGNKINEFNSLTDAKEKCNISMNHISNNLSGKIEKTKVGIFKYKN